MAKNSDIKKRFVYSIEGRKNKLIILTIDDDSEHLYFLPLRPNGQYQEVAVGIAWEELIKKTLELDSGNQEIVFLGPNASGLENQDSEKVVINRFSNEPENVEVICIKPGTYEFKIRISKRLVFARRLPFQEVKMVVNRKRLLSVLKLFVRDYGERG